MKSLPSLTADLAKTLKDDDRFKWFAERIGTGTGARANVFWAFQHPLYPVGEPGQLHLR